MIIGNQTVYFGQVISNLRKLPSNFFNTVVTSPPYWNLRDYGVVGQIGLEPTVDDYVATMVAVFDEVKRVLRDDGTAWLNLGDSYAGSWGAQSRSKLSPAASLSQRQIETHPKQTHTGSLKRTPGLKPKDLVGVPWRVALALQHAGWFLRQDIIWHKPSPMPSSVKDRCTTAHEYIFLLSKSKKYYYDQEAIAELSVSGNNGSKFTIGKTAKENTGTGPRGNYSTRNKRSVWTVASKGYKGAHFACFPPKLIEPCILAGSPEQCCSECGTGYVRIIEKVRVPTRPGTNSKVNRASAHQGSPANSHSGSVVGNRDPHRHVTRKRTVGFKPSCDCKSSSTMPGVVLDPFVGSGTTLQVCEQHGRRGFGIELNKDYRKLIESRLEGVTASV